MKRSVEGEGALKRNPAFSLPTATWECPSDAEEATAVEVSRRPFPPQRRIAAWEASFGEGGKPLNGMWLFDVYDEVAGERDVETDSTRALWFRIGGQIRACIIFV